MSIGHFVAFILLYLNTLSVISNNPIVSTKGSAENLILTDNKYAQKFYSRSLVPKTE